MVFQWSIMLHTLKLLSVNDYRLFFPFPKVSRRRVQTQRSGVLGRGRILLSGDLPSAQEAVRRPLGKRYVSWNTLFTLNTSRGEIKLEKDGWMSGAVPHFGVYRPWRSIDLRTAQGNTVVRPHLPNNVGSLDNFQKCVIGGDRFTIIMMPLWFRRLNFLWNIVQ